MMSITNPINFSLSDKYSNKIDTKDMMRHINFMENEFGSMVNVPEDHPELQLLRNQLDTRSDEELLPQVAKLRRQRKQMNEIQDKLHLSWFRLIGLLTSYRI